MFLTGSVFFFLFFLSFGSHSECFHTKSLSDPFQLHFARLFNIQRNAGIAVLNCNSRESIFKNYYQLLLSSLNASCPLRSDIPSIPSFFFYLRALVLRTDCICYKNEPSTTILINQLYMQCLICMIDFCNSTRNFRGFLYKIVSISLTQKKKKEEVSSETKTCRFLHYVRLNWSLEQQESTISAARSYSQFITISLMT